MMIDGSGAAPSRAGGQRKLESMPVFITWPNSTAPSHAALNTITLLGNNTWPGDWFSQVCAHLPKQHQQELVEGHR